MRARLLAVALGLVLLGALLVRGTGRGAAWAPFPTPPRPRVAGPRPILPRPAPTSQGPSRNLFQYADGATVGNASPVPVPLDGLRGSGAAAPPIPTATPSAVRVAGLVRRGGQLKAALMVRGEMTLAGKGERAAGYTVLEVDEESGVRLRGPDGEEIVLPPPRF